jgi:hypothetical protein
MSKQNKTNRSENRQTRVHAYSNPQQDKRDCVSSLYVNRVNNPDYSTLTARALICDGAID